MDEGEEEEEEGEGALEDARLFRRLVGLACRRGGGRAGLPRVVAEAEAEYERQGKAVTVAQMDFTLDIFWDFVQLFSANDCL